MAADGPGTGGLHGSGGSVHGSCWALLPLGAGARELLGFGSCGSWVWLTPLYPLAVLGWSLGMCCVPPSISCDLCHLCAQCGGGEQRGAGGCWYVHKPWDALPIPLLSSEARMWLPGPDLCPGSPEATSSSGDYTSPCYCCVASGRQWHRLPACLLSQLSGCAAPCHSPSAP